VKPSPAPSSQAVLLRNATLFDSLHGRMQPSTQILIEGERVAAVTTEAVTAEGRHVIDLGGATVLPGLVDAHVHVTAATIDLMAQALETPSLVVARTSAVMRDMLRRGFTSVRDAGGADCGLQESVAKGLFEGPRLFIAGFPISQTGGHADMRPRGVRHEGFFCTCAGLGLIGAIADGVGEARKRTREQVRTGANQIKIMAGGGVASPTDPIQGTQFSMDELRAICEEAEAANLYAMAHAYSPRAVTRAVQAGVRSIEHGNLIDEATAREMKRAGAYLVPTLSTYAAFADTGRQAGWSEGMQAKFDLVWTAGARSLEIAKAEGVPIVFGTDLLGSHHPRQLGEFALRARVLSPIEQLQGATSIAARLMGQEGRIGVVAPGAFADLIVMEGDPTRDISLMGDLPARTKLLMQGGRAVVDTIGAAGHS
jgi:imidazolonepropionase-like amidohydrolase